MNPSVSDPAISDAFQALGPLNFSKGFNFAVFSHPERPKDSGLGGRFIEPSHLEKVNRLMVGLSMELYSMIGCMKAYQFEMFTLPTYIRNNHMRLIIVVNNNVNQISLNLIERNLLCFF